MTFIDSDKGDAAADFSNEKKKIIQAMAEAGIEGHILHKREMENYFTEANYRAAGIIAPGVPVPVYTDEEWDCEARRYYFNIVGKYGLQVQNLLKKISNLEYQKIVEVKKKP